MRIPNASGGPYRQRRGSLQRLYSTFANGWPGFGLLLLRLAVCIFVVEGCLSDVSLHRSEVWLSAIAAVGGLLILAGLWTPVAAIGAALLQLWIVIRTDDARPAHLLAAAIAAGLAVLGPGAWSVDARLFGRRRISIADR